MHTNTFRPVQQRIGEKEGKDLLTIIFFPSINTHFKWGRDEGGETGELKEQRDRAVWDTERGMKDGVGTASGGHVMTSDVVNQLDGVLQESGSSSH